MLTIAKLTVDAPLTEFRDGSWRAINPKVIVVAAQRRAAELAVIEAAKQLIEAANHPKIVMSSGFRLHVNCVRHAIRTLDAAS